MSDQLKLTENPERKSAKRLVNLYTVIIGVSLTYSVAVLIPDRKLNSITSGSLLLFLAYIATLLPFYHGASLHLDNSYFTDGAPARRPAALIFDFALLFLQALGFVFLAVLIRSPLDFSTVLLVILCMDVVWGVFAGFATDSRKGLIAPFRWALINAVFVLIGVGVLLGLHLRFDAKSFPACFEYSVFAFAALRTMVDYGFCFPFYFPKTNASETVSGIDVR